MGRCFWWCGSLDSGSPGRVIGFHPSWVQRRMRMLVVIVKESFFHF